MLILKFLFYFFIIPEVLGLGILQFSKKQKTNCILAIIVGYIYSFTIYELISIPMIFANQKFSFLTNIWIILMLISFFISFILMLKNIKNIVKENTLKYKDANKKLLFLFIILVLIQAFIGFYYMHEDYDDSNFVAKATIAYDTDTLYKYDDKGVVYEKLPSRQVLSPFPIYTASIAKIFDLHPAIIAHTVFPPVFIILAYLLYYLIADALFKNDEKLKYIFLILLNIIYVFGAYSVWSNFVFLLYRPWQGKALIANIFLPLIWLLFIKYLNEDNFYWGILFMCLWAADLVSSMGLFIPSIAAFVLAIIYTISQKDKKYILKTLVCFIPSIIYGLIYLKIR